MSRGHGRVQQVVLDLIETQPEGVWSTSDLCLHVYRGTNRVEKKHRVAVSRGLRTMKLPQHWAVRYGDRQGGEQHLYNRLSVESTAQMRWLAFVGRNRCTYEEFREHYSHQVDKAEQCAADYKRYFEADELGRIKIDIAEEQKRLGLLKTIGGSAEFARSIADHTTALLERKAVLEAAMVDGGSV